MKFTEGSTDSIKSASGALSSFQNYSFQRFIVSVLPRSPLSPPQPSSPRLQSGHQLFQRPSPQKQFPSNKELQAQPDEEKLEAFRGTISLPFAPGDHRRVAAKVSDDRGIESPKVINLE
ncbi:MAG: hypothetical protein WCI46_13250 [Verrucomicrobiota bacterium]